jgi:hypothetical protein
LCCVLRRRADRCEAVKIPRFLNISDLYIWNRVTLQNAEPSQFIEQRSAFLPVEGRPKHVIYHVMAAGRDETNSSLPTIMSTKRHDQTDDADRLPVREATSAWMTLDGTAGDDQRLKRRSLEYCNRQRLKWSETSEEGRCRFIFFQSVSGLRISFIRNLLQLADFRGCRKYPVGHAAYRYCAQGQRRLFLRRRRSTAPTSASFQRQCVDNGSVSVAFPVGTSAAATVVDPTTY